MMRKILLGLALFLSFLVAHGAYSTGYYDRMDGKRREALKRAVRECVETHKRLGYSALPDYWQYSDVYPELTDGCRRWWDMYSDAVYLILEDQTARQSFSANKMQREHSVPKSWWKKNGDVEYTPAYSDLWNLYPSDGTANREKSNYPFGPCATTVTAVSFYNGVSKVGIPLAGYGGGSAKVFEPADEYKGDFARSIFYMACVYSDLEWVVNYMFRQEDYPTLAGWAVNMLLQWARQDGVSQKEIDRNNAVEQSQGNRNPFIDFPELAEYIWGRRITETFLIADQENMDPTPPAEGEPGLTEPVDGERIDFGQIAVNHAVTRTLKVSGTGFTEPLSLRLGGTNGDSFRVSADRIPADKINASSGYLLDVTWLPATLGRHKAELTLSGAGLRQPVNVSLSGVSLEEPVMETLRALDPTDISSTGYTANWEAPSGLADYYLLTRVRYIGDDQEPETYETEDTSWTFADRDPEIPETYTVQYSRLGILSPMSNTIYVAANGVNTLQVEIPYRLCPVQEGFVLLTGDGMDLPNLTVTDPSGLVIFSGTVSHGSTVSLPAGFYIITVLGHKPHKLTVR